jgi:hypothetical protein
MIYFHNERGVTMSDYNLIVAQTLDTAIHVGFAALIVGILLGLAAAKLCR